MDKRLTKSLVSTVVGLTMALSLVVGVGSASALTASELLNLLIAAGVIAPDKVAAAQAAMTATTVTVTSGYNYTRDLTMGSTGADVTALQNYLISGGYMASGYPFGYFGAITRTALGKFQLANGISPTAGYFGRITRAKIIALGTTSNTTTTTTTTTTTGTTLGTDLAVRLAASSPSASAIVAGQAAADLAEYTFTNNTATPAVVTNIAFARLGVSSDTTLSSVYLYNGAMRLTDAASVSSAKITFNSGSGLFTVPAGSSVTIAVKADILAATNGQQVAVALTGVTSNVTLNASLPITGATMSIFLASDIAGVTVGVVTSPATSTQTGVTVQAGTLNSTIWSAPLNVSTRAVNLRSVAFKVIGSIPSGAFQNIKLYVSGIQVATASGVDANGMITFDLTSAPYKIDSNRTLEVRADVVNGSGRTFSVSLQNIADIAIYDSSYNIGIGVTNTDLTAFTAKTTGTITITNGSVTVTLDSTLGSGNVVAGSTNVPLAKYILKAYGEDEKISYLYATVNRTTDNVALYANGIQIGSTQSVTLNVAKLFSLGSSLIIPAGTTVSLEIRGDLKNAGTNFATGTTVIATLTGYTNNAQGSYSSTLTTVPSAAIAGPTMTVAGAVLTVAKNAAVADYSTVANLTAQRIGSFVIQTNSSEAAKVTQLTVALGGSLPTANMSNLYVAVAGETNTTPINPAATNNFTTNFTIPANGSTVVDVYGDIGAIASVANTADTQTFVTATSTAGVNVVAAIAATGTVTVGTSTTAGWAVGHVVTVTINGFATNFTVAAPGTGIATNTAITTGLAAAINANTNVNGIVTASSTGITGTTTVVLITAKTAGTVGNYSLTVGQATASTTVSAATLVNGAAATTGTAQIASSTPATVEIGDVFTLVVDGTTYTVTATAATAANVVNLFVTALAADTAVTAVNTGNVLILTAKAARIGSAIPVITSSATNGTHSTTNTVITTITATGYGISSNLTLSGSKVGQTVTIGTGSLSDPTLASGSGYSPDAQLVVGETSSVIAYFNFKANTSSATIKELYFSATGTSVLNNDSPITSITVGGITVPSASSTFSVTGLNIAVPVGNAGYNLPVTVTFASVGTSTGGIASNKTATLRVNGFKYTSGNTDTYSPTTGYTLTSSNIEEGNLMTLVASKPTITMANPSDTTVGGGGVVEVARITISADAKGPIKVLAIPLSQIVTGDGASATTTTLKVGATTVAITDGFAASVGTTTAVTGTLTITGGYDIAAGSSATFSVYKNVTLTNANLSLDTIRTTLGAAASFSWTDVKGDADINGSAIYNYPTNVAVTSY